LNPKVKPQVISAGKTSDKSAGKYIKSAGKTSGTINRIRRKII
jgi:hypothetical protein